MSDTQDGSTGSDGALDVRRRRLRFRAWHRGTREMDLLMGRFVDSELAALPDAEIDELEQLMEAPDRDVYSWLSGELQLPVNYDTSVFRRLRAFHTHDAPLHG